MLPEPELNFEILASLNSHRPQTSHGGIFERQRSLQKNQRQQSSRLFDKSGFNNFELMSNNKLSQIMKKDVI